MRRPEGLNAGALKLWLCAALAFLSFETSLADEYRWSAPVERALLAPTDSTGSVVRGASLQGGLIDLRYGQASIDLGGEGIVLDWNDSTVFTLNGSSCSADALNEYLKTEGGLVVAVRYNPSTGMMGWCDAIHTAAFPAVNLDLVPWKALYSPGEKIVVRIASAESKRLALVSPSLFAPGMAHDLPLKRNPRGEWSGVLPVMTGWDWKELPLFVRSGSVFRGKTISVSSTPPRIGDCGPTIASEWLHSIPGWFQLEGNLMFLDPSSIRVKASSGAVVTDVFPRRDRVDFSLKVPGSGTYEIEASAADLAGREIRKTWTFSVQR